tara:strand:- start:255 stop:746 length:492 start_codon:yes stop_codon:yes gene_type:complete
MKKILFTITIFFLMLSNLFAEKGSYDIVYVGSHNLNSVSTNDGSVTGGMLDGIFTVTKSTGSLYKVGDNAKSTCIILSKKNNNKNNSQLEAFCETVDINSGDKSFTYNVRKEGTVQAGSEGKGKQTIIGGTGKFKGISGLCNYTVKYLPDNKLTTVGTCEYKI